MLQPRRHSERSRSFRSLRHIALNLALLLVLFVSPLPAARPAAAEELSWTRLGLAGQRINAVAISPVNSQVIYAGTHGDGVHRSADSGASWMAVNTGLNNRFVNTLLADQANASVVYAGTGESAAQGDANHGVYKSTDGGVNWIRHLDAHVNALVQSPVDGRVLYAAGGIPFARSSNAGLEWSPVITTALMNLDLRDLKIHPAQPQTLLAVGTTEGGSGRVVRSPNAGGSWTIVADVGLPATLAVTFAGAEGEAILLGTTTGIWRSADAGQNWQRIMGNVASTQVLTLLANPKNPRTVFAGTAGNGVLVSEDAGASWKVLPGGLVTATVRSLAVDDASPQSLYAGTNDGVWRIPVGAAVAPLAPVDATIQIVWPHDNKPVAQATMVNITAYIFEKDSRRPVPCLYPQTVRLWRSLNNAPAEPVAVGVRRIASKDGKTFAVWDFNDIPVDQATNPANKYAFRLTIDGVDARSNVWIHGADARTIFPQQDVPTGIGPVTATLDAKVQIVWPHDGQGTAASVATATKANIVVDLYDHGTLQSVPADFNQPVRLFSSLNAGLEAEIGVGQRITETRGGIAQPRWVFNDVDVDAARTAANKLSFRPQVDGVTTYGSVWIHGVDARTIFPMTDTPESSCE